MRIKLLVIAFAASLLFISQSQAQQSASGFPKVELSRVHQRATLVELSQLDGCEPELFGQIRHGSDRVLVVARQKDDPMAPLDDRGRSCFR